MKKINNTIIDHFFQIHGGGGVLPLRQMETPVLIRVDLGIFWKGENKISIPVKFSKGSEERCT